MGLAHVTHRNAHDHDSAPCPASHPGPACVHAGAVTRAR